MRSRAFITKCLGYPRQIKCWVSISAFNRKSSSLEHRRLTLTNCEYGIPFSRCLGVNGFTEVVEYVGCC